MPRLHPSPLRPSIQSAVSTTPVWLVLWLRLRGNFFMDRVHMQHFLIRMVSLLLTVLVSLPTVSALAQSEEETNALKGHLSAIVMGSITPDGNRAITASTDQTARVWDLATRSMIREYTGHTGPLYCMALSGNGRVLATGAQDNSLRIWDVPQSTPLLSLAAHNATASGIAMTSDGRLLVTVGSDNKVRVWDTAALDAAAASGTAMDPNTLSKVLNGHEAAITAVAVRPDGSMIATADVSGKILFWSPFLDQPRGSVEGPGVISLAFNGNTSQLFSCGIDGVVRQWEIPPTAIRQLDPLPQPILRLAVSKSQALALVTTADQSSRLLQLDNGQVVREFPAAGSPVVVTAISPSNSVIAVGDSEGNVRVLNASSGEIQYVFKVPGGTVAGLVFHSDNQRVFTSGADGVIRLWKPMAPADPNAAAAMPTGSSDGFQWAVNPAGSAPLASNSDASSVFTGGVDGKVRQVSSADGAVQKTFEGHTAAITDLAVSPNNQRLASVSRDTTLRVWNVGDGNTAFEVKHPGPITTVSWSPDGLTLATAAEDGCVRLFAADSGQLLEKFSSKVAGWSAAAWLNTAGMLLTASNDKSLRVLKRSATRSFAPHTSEVAGMAMVGAQVLTGWKDGKVILSDVNSGKATREFAGCSGAIRAIAVRGDGLRLAAGGADGKVYLWNASNGELLQTLESAAPVVALAWSFDNQKLAVATEDRQLRLYGPAVASAQNTTAGSELQIHQQTAADSAIAAMVFSADNRSLRAVHGSGQMAIWSYAAPTSLRQFNQGGAVYGIAISRDGSTIISCGADQSVRVWDNNTGSQRFQMSGHQGAVHSVALSPDESFAVSSGADKTIRLWDIVGGRQLKQLATLDGTMYSVAIHPNGQTIATAGADRKIYLMDMITGAIQKTLEGHTDYIHCVAFNPAGTRLISYGYAGQVRVWDAASGNLIWENRVGRIGNFVSYDTKGISVLLSSGDGVARLISLPENAR